MQSVWWCHPVRSLVRPLALRQWALFPPAGATSVLQPGAALFQPAPHLIRPVELLLQEPVPHQQQAEATAWPGRRRDHSHRRPLVHPASRRLEARSAATAHLA